MASRPFQRCSKAHRGSIARFLEGGLPHALKLLGALEEEPESIGDFFADDPGEPSWVVHSRRGWFALCAGPRSTERGEVERALPALDALAREVGMEQGELRLGGVAPAVHAALARRRPLLRANACSLYQLDPKEFRPRDAHPTEPLREEDALLVASHWPYGDEVGYVLERIRRAPSAAVRERGSAVSWMIVHGDGSIGSLHTLESHRGRGLARSVVSALVRAQLARGRTPYCYVVQGNTPSIRVFESLGFRRLAEAFWVVAGR
ncbi:MAG: GNAT family N-acetyltransferase [Nitrospinota bacterium]